uniref:Transthyretin-like family protein n=2 Tax=Caenorhabditis japonica TaxID=281687 RepID=A0A8R1ED12_CAEJA
MKVIIFFAATFVLAECFRARGIKASVTLVAKCEKPKDPHARVFLMERDFGDSLFDEDDTLNFGNIYLGKKPEEKLQMTGIEAEYFGIEPYLVVVHSCNKDGDMERYTMDLEKGMETSSHFDVVLDLDKQQHTISQSPL